VKIQIVNLSEENLKNIPVWESYPYSCKYCIYWEYPEKFITLKKKNKDEIFQEKLEWLRRVKKEFGDCGKLIYIDRKPVGYAQFASPKFLPNLMNYDAGHPDKDSVIISCLFICNKNYRSLGLGKRLLESIIDDLKSRGIKIVETFARKDKASNPSGPVEFYIKNRFRVYKDDPQFPLMRLDL
jgi:GNAT superfamily N-acetyltransferase